VSGSWLERVDPLIKIGGAMVWTATLMFVNEPRAIAVFAGVGALLVLAAGGLRRPWVLLGALIWLASLGGFHLLIGGTAAQALVTVGRVATLVAIGASLALTTDPGDLLRSLHALPLPASLRLGLHITWRAVGVLRQELAAIRFAALVDGRALGVGRPFELFRFGLLPLAFRMTAFADEMTLALQSRGITLEGRGRRLRRRPYGPGEALFTSLVVATLALVGGLSL
jgi:energy-coupling factor transporter transmembrane protein EcfT